MKYLHQQKGSDDVAITVTKDELYRITLALASEVDLLNKHNKTIKMMANDKEITKNYTQLYREFSDLNGKINY